MKLEITKYGNPILTQKGKLVDVFDKELKTLAQNMIETMHEAEGIGLAAQQVGIAKQIAVVDLLETCRNFDGDPQDMFSYSYDGRRLTASILFPLVLVNPIVTVLNNKMIEREEGCLSFKGLKGIVPRPEHIKVDFQDLNGDKHTIECDSIFARCVQHEVDHLHGILFIDRMIKKVVSAIKNVAEVAAAKS